MFGFTKKHVEPTSVILADGQVELTIIPDAMIAMLVIRYPKDVTEDEIDEQLADLKKHLKRRGYHLQVFSP